MAPEHQAVGSRCEAQSVCDKAFGSASSAMAEIAVPPNCAADRVAEAAGAPLIVAPLGAPECVAARDDAPPPPWPKPRTIRWESCATSSLSESADAETLPLPPTGPEDPAAATAAFVRSLGTAAFALAALAPEAAGVAGRAAEGAGAAAEVATVATVATVARGMGGAALAASAVLGAVALGATAAGA